MNTYLSICGLISIIITLIHLLPGGREVVRPFRAAPMDGTVRETMYACWHVVTADLLLSSLALLGMGLSGSIIKPLIQYIAIHFIAYGLVFVVVAFFSNLKNAAKQLPQWALLTPLGLALLFAT